MKTIYDPRYVRLTELLVRRRKELGLTQEQVARKLRRTRSWTGKCEQRERRLDIVEVKLLCELYGIRFADVEAVLADAKRP